MFGVGSTPVRVEKAEAVLVGTQVGSHTVEDVARLVSKELEPVSDIHATAQYRKEVGGVQARRTLLAALDRAGEVASQ